MYFLITRLLNWSLSGPIQVIAQLIWNELQLIDSFKDQNFHFSIPCCRQYQNLNVLRQIQRKSLRGSRLNNLNLHILSIYWHLTFVFYNFKHHSKMSLNYFAVASGRINVTSTGAKALQNMRGRPSCPWYATSLKASTLRAQLENRISELQTKCGFPGITPTNHHIFPGKNITIMLIEALAQHTNTIDMVNRYINSRLGINGYLMELYNLGEQTAALEEVYSSVFWHEFNLVLGPTNKRNNEPGDKIDYEALGVQSSAVQNYFASIDQNFRKRDYYAALETFLNMRVMFNGNWIIAVNNQWNLFPNKPPISPATTGFAYDIWPWYRN